MFPSKINWWISILLRIFLGKWKLNGKTAKLIMTIFAFPIFSSYLVSRCFSHNVRIWWVFCFLNYFVAHLSWLFDMNSVDNIFNEQQSCHIKHAFPLIISLRQVAQHQLTDLLNKYVYEGRRCYCVMKCRAQLSGWTVRWPAWTLDP